MKIEIAFRDDEAARLLWLLRQKYDSKANLPRLAKAAIRKAAAEQATVVLAAVGEEGDE